MINLLLSQQPLLIRHLASCPLLLAVVLSVLLSTTAFGDDEAAAAPTTFRAAAAEVTITPKGAVPIPNLTGVSTGVAAELYARVLVVDDGQAPIAIITTDLTGGDIAYAQAVAKSIEETTGIPARRVMFNCSHTHNAPGVSLPADPNEPSYGREVLEKIVEITVEAMANLKPARIMLGRESVQIGFNRRMPAANGITMTVNPNGPVVPWVDVLGVYGTDGSRIGILFSYAAHPVVIHGSSTLISPDYPGYAATHLRRMLSQGERKGGVMMFAQGCGGNINAFPLKGGIDASNRVGLVLAQAVTRVQLQEIQPALVRGASLEVGLPFRKPMSVEEAEKLLARQPDNVGYQRLAKLAKVGPSPDMPYPMSAFAIGDQLCIIALPRETFCDYQLWADQKSPYQHTFVFGYTNGSFGYVAAKKDYDLGMYRAGYGVATGGGSMPLSSETEATIHDGICRLWKKLEIKE